MDTLRGRRVLVTGASSGIGPFLARRLSEEGASLILSARNRGLLDQVAAELRPAEVIVADLSLPGEVEALAEQAAPVDVLVANAAVPASGELVSFSVEQIDRALDVNLRSAIVLANRLLPGMLARRSGHVILMASLHGKLPAALVSVYNATKFGLRGFGLALGLELKGTGVGVSVINPTFVRGAGMWAETGASTHALAGLATPHQVADAVIRGIKENQAEIDVAPLGARLAIAAPRLIGTVARRLGATAIPPAAVEHQAAKR
jgi:short-subunit dehydrogenase